MPASAADASVEREHQRQAASAESHLIGLLSRVGTREVPRRGVARNCPKRTVPADRDPADSGYSDCGSTSTTADSAVAAHGGRGRREEPGRRGSQTLSDSTSSQGAATGGGRAAGGAEQAPGAGRPGSPRPSPSSARARRGRFRVRSRDDECHEMRKRWVPELLPSLRAPARGTRRRRGARRTRTASRRAGTSGRARPRGVAAAPSRELRHELERPLLRPEVGEREAGVGVDDGRDRDPREVMALGDHLRPDERGRAGRRAKRSSASRSAPGPSGRVRVEPDPLETGDAARELGLEPLRPRADARQLDRPAARAALGQLLGVPAVVAVETAVRVERQRDVAAPAPSRQSARPTVDRARDPPPVEEEDRAAAPLLDLRELGEERRREGVPRLAPEVDETHRRERRADPRRELDALEAGPALRPRRRAPVDGDRALQRRALRGDRPRVVAGIRLLLVRGVVLLVDDDQPEIAHGREHRRARTDDDARLSGRDALPLVAALGVARGPSAAIATSSPKRCAEPPERLRRQRDLRDEDDRALARARASRRTPGGRPRSCRSPWARGAGGARHPRRAPPTTRSTAAALRRRQLLRLRLARQRLADRRRSSLRRRAGVRGATSDERARGRRAVVVGEPERELDELSRKPLDDSSRPRRPRRREARRRRSRRRRRGAVRPPRRTDTTAPRATSSGTSYVNGRASARAETSG